MRLLLTRKTLSVRFAAVCFALMTIATSMMTFVLYEIDNALAVKANANIITEVDGPKVEAITEDFMMGVYYDSVIVSPDISPEEGSVELLEIETETEPTEPAEPAEPTEPAEPAEPAEPTEPNRNKIDIGLLKSKEYLPDYKYGVQTVPTTTIPDTASNTDMRNCTDVVDTSEYLYLGTYSITGYTPKCAHCCGNTKGITASGVEATVGYTVAADSSIPFGTTLYIEGYGYYVVEDRGNFGKNVIDIAAPTHESCYELTNYGVHVYVVPSTNN